MNVTHGGPWAPTVPLHHHLRQWWLGEAIALSELYRYGWREREKMEGDRG